jgi:exodeoxyribonuclease-5
MDGEHAIQLANEMNRIEELIREERSKTKGPRFRLNPDSILKDARLLILDECSMVGKKLGEDVLSFRKKVLVLGDPAQLPPVMGSGFFTGRNPNRLLTEIHRQAADSSVIRLATAIRHGKRIDPEDYSDDGVRILDRKEIRIPEIADMVQNGAQVLCGKNRTRRTINLRIRKKLGFDGAFPKSGEKLVVLRNDSELGVLNGVVCLAASDAIPDVDDDCHMVRLDYEGRLIPMTPLDRGPFLIYRDPSIEEWWSPGINRHMLQADWGYAITVHKAQGSEWDDVILRDDGFGLWKNAGDLRKQWLYTAVTRAAERFVWAR